MRKRVMEKWRLFPAAGLVAVVFLMAFILLGAPPARAEESSPSACWQPIGPALATDWYVRQVVASPHFAEDQTLFAATGSNNLNDLSLEGVFVSRDGGKNWRHVLARQRVTVIGVSPGFARDGTVIAANTGGNVFISQDRGETWQGTTDIPSNTAWAVAISTTFSTDKTVFLGGARGLLVSTDGGYHWQSLPTAPQNITCLAISPDFRGDQTLFAGVIGTYEKNGIYRSTDGGKTWQVVGLKGIAVKDIVLSPDFSEDRTAYAVGGHLYKSTDGGTSWDKISIEGANGSCLTLSPNFRTDRTVFVGTEGIGTSYYDGVLRCRDGLQERLVCGLLGKTERDLVAVAVNSGVRLFAAVTMRDRLWGEIYTLTITGQGQPEVVTKEGLVQRGIEYPYWLAVQTEDARYALLQDPAHPEEYAKLKGLLGEKVRVTGYLDTGPGFPDPVKGHIRVTKVEPLTEPVTGQVIINDPSFVTLTAVANPDHHLMWATDFVLEVKAMDPSLPVEISYLITDSNGTPTSPTTGVENRENNFIAGWDPGGQHFYHTEIGGWALPQFTTNPQYFPLPHYRTCVLLLARYDKVYAVFLRENDGQLTYKVLKGGPFTGLDVPGLGKVTRQGNRFEVRSYGGPVEVGLWAKGQYIHDEVAGWALPEFKKNPKYYDIPHYGMFMLMIARYDKIGLIIGNENDGQLGAVCLTGSRAWTAETVPDLCTLTPVHLRCAEGARCPNSWPAVEVKATGSDPVEVSHFAFDNTCWQWEVNGWAKPEFAPNPQTFALKHYTPGFLMVSRYGKVGIFFYNENDGQLGVLPAEAVHPVTPITVLPVVFRIGQKNYEAGGQKFSMDVAPYVKNGRSYVPIRYLANALGVRDQDITWDPNTQTVALKKGGTALCLTVGSRIMKRQVGPGPAEEIRMDVTPETANGRLCLPARYVAQGFGFQVAWDPDKQEVFVGCETTTSPVAGVIWIEPYTPLDINAAINDAIEVQTQAEPLRIYYIPLQQVVWGYRVYIYAENTPEVHNVLGPDWQWDESAGGWYYDCPATYYCDGSAVRQLNPQPVLLPGDVSLRQAYNEYKIFPLTILVNPPPGVNVDKNNYPFNYFFRLYTSYGKHFIWKLYQSSEWGYVVNEGGQAERGYSVCNRVVKEGMLVNDLSPPSSGGAGPSAGGPRLPPFPIPI